MSMVNTVERIAFKLPSGHVELVERKCGLKLYAQLGRSLFDRDDLFELVVTTVSSIWGLSTSSLHQKTKRPSVAYPRMVVMAFLMQLGFPSTKVAGWFGMDHGSALHAHERVGDLKSVERDFADKYALAVKALKAAGYNVR